MRELQIAGIAISGLLLVFGFWALKSGRSTRQSHGLLLAFSSGLLVLSLYPAAGDLVAKPLQMERWFAVLFTTNLAAFALIWACFNRASRNVQDIGRLVRALAHARYRQEFPNTAKEGCIAVLIPAFNEGESLGSVLRRVPAEIDGRTVQTFVIVDGARDKTETVARTLGCPVIVHPINLGGGAALRAGYELALASSAEIVVTLDADGQHLPEEIPQLVAPILANQVDFVNGSRILGTFEANGRIRRLGILFFNTLISLLMLRRVTDCSNSFRAIRSQMLSVLCLRENQFHTSEFLIAALKQGARFMEVPITIRSRSGGESKKPGPLRYGFEFARAMLMAWLR